MYRLGDTVMLGIELAIYNPSENTLAYVLAGELAPSVIIKRTPAVLTTQEMVDEYNRLHFG